MGEQAVALAKAVDYDSAGTVEFVASGADKSFYFLEMNTRLQVEHPVTEMITGVDLVEQMLRVAAGEELAIGQDDLSIQGWAVETRLYAEDPYRGFLPSIGRLKRFAMPEDGGLGEGTVRVDSGVREGDEISMFYDPMIAKLVTHGADRIAAIDTHSLALDQVLVDGIQDNSPFLSAVMEEARFRSGDLTTGYIKDQFPDGFDGAPLTNDRKVMFAALAAAAHAKLAARAGDLSGRMTPQKPPRADWSVLIGEERFDLTVKRDGDASEIGLNGATHRVTSDWDPTKRFYKGDFDGRSFVLKFAETPEGYRMDWRGTSAMVVVCTPRSADLHALIPEKEKPDSSKLIVSPMPGLVVSIEVSAGQEVKQGEAVAIVEAMKMQNIIRAEANGTVKTVAAEPGASVAADELLVELS